jgi:hypothetical protein
MFDRIPGAEKIAGIVAESVARGTSATLERKARRVLREENWLGFERKRHKKRPFDGTAFLV